MPPEASAQPVRYVNGEVLVSSVDLASNGFGTNWSQTRAYSNQIAANGDYGQGYNWLVLNWPIATQQGSPDHITIMRGTQAALWFDLVSSVYVGRYGTKSTLTHDSLRQVYILTFPDGSVNEFQDFTVSATIRGAFAKQVSPTGNVTEVTLYTPDGQIAEIHQTGSVDGQSLTDAFLYEYNSDHRVTSVKLRRQRGLFGWVDILQAIYEYYEAGEDFGSEGDLKRVQRQVPATAGWATTQSQYYRYYQAGDLNGFPHGLRYIVEPATYEKMVANGYDPLTVSNAIIALFADNYFEYDSQQRAILEQVNGASQTFTFEYTPGTTSTTDYNVWTMKTVETLPDGNQNVVYSNLLGSPLIRELFAGSDHWISAYHYDNQGRSLWQASPSAVLGYNDAQPDLAISLRAHDGLISLTEYYSTSGSGAAAGYVAARKIRQGASGDAITLATFEYLAQTVGTTDFYFLASQTAYRNDDGTGGIESSFDYTYYPDTAQIQQQTTTLPVVPTGQNGSGVAATRKTYFDIWNQPIWLMDERGIITRQTFDLPTGALIQRIDDVDTSLVTDAPSGWATPTGAGLNLVTDYLLDSLGRTVQSLGPAHEVDLNGTATTIRQAQWTVFEDVEHQTATGAGYQVVGVPEPYCELVNPVTLAILDADGKRLQDIAAVSADTNGGLSVIVADAGGISATFPQESYARWATYQYTDCCLLESQRVYHTIPSSGEGVSGTNYDQTNYGYDVMKRRNRIVTPGGTITDLVYDARSLVISTYVGTNDDGATESDPTGGGSDPDNNMVLVTSNEYDNDSDEGDGNLTQQTQAVNASVNRITSMTYDFRNRLITTDGEVDYFQKLYYDNLSRIIKTERYDTTAAGNLIARSETKFDDRGRIYQSIVYGVDPSTGTVGNSLVDNTWYDASSNVVKTLPSGSALFVKTTYDSLARPTVRYAGYDLDESSYAEALIVTGDVIMTQTETEYDDANNLIQVTSRQRYHDAPDSQTGALQDPTTTPKARVTYAAVYYDGVNRQIASADYGTNGGTALSRSSTIPAASDDCLVALTTYDQSGKVLDITDPAGIVTRTEYDDAGRRLTTIENFQSSSSSSSSNSSSGSGCGVSDDTNRTTQFTYTPDGQQATMTAVNSDTTNQTTIWTYGTTLTDSDIATSILLRSITYPNSVSGSDVVSYTSNRQGQRTSLTDQRGCVHQYDYDLLGRPIQDRVTTTGAGVDDAVLRISSEYEVRGLLDKLTSWNNPSISAGDAVNEVQWTYNEFGQSIQTFQAHDGQVNPMSTASVQMGYENGSANTIRPTTLTYPNGRVVTNSYGASGSITDACSQVASLIDSDVGSTHLANYSYLGLGAVVQQDSPEADLQYTLVSLAGTNDPDTGDIYTGLDRFGRVKDCRWRNTSSNADISRVQYGYNRDSSRIWRANPTDPDQHYDWLYNYDGLQRLKSGNRGTLNSTKTAITDPQFAQCWTLDATGNWIGFRQDDDGNSSWDLVQARTANPVNEITGITNSVGSAWVNPTYDVAGNMTTMPQPADPTKGYTAIYDAWNRLSSLSDTSASDVVQQNEYDGRNYRIVRKDYTSGTLSETRNFYYTDGWQDVEERMGASPDSVSPHQQYAWGVEYIDDVVCRNRSVSGTLDERLYGCQDANWNVTAIVDTNGAIQERYEYDPYGDTHFLSPSFIVKVSSDCEWSTLFSTYYIDSATGLYDVRHRIYLSLTGTWLTRDPLGYNALSWNLYQYADSRPCDHTDYLGLIGPGNGLFLPGITPGLPGPQYVNYQPPRYPKGSDIANTARKYQGSKSWLDKIQKDNFKPGTSKCNKFVCDVCNESGAMVPLTRGGNWLLRTSPPTAYDWSDATVNIPGWVVVKEPKPGDVVAIGKNPNEAGSTGHVGIVVSDGETASAAFVKDDDSISGVVKVNDWGFREGQTPTFRRFIGLTPEDCTTTGDKQRNEQNAKKTSE